MVDMGLAVVARSAKLKALPQTAMLWSPALAGPCPLLTTGLLLIQKARLARRLQREERWNTIIDDLIAIYHIHLVGHLVESCYFLGYIQHSGAISLVDELHVRLLPEVSFLYDSAVILRHQFLFGNNLAWIYFDILLVT